MLEYFDLSQLHDIIVTSSLVTLLIALAALHFMANFAAQHVVRDGTRHQALAALFGVVAFLGFLAYDSLAVGHGSSQQFAVTAIRALVAAGLAYQIARLLAIFVLPMYDACRNTIRKSRQAVQRTRSNWRSRRAEKRERRVAARERDNQRKREREEERQQQQHVKRQIHRLDRTLERLDEAPDLRRVVSAVRKATNIPVHVRRRRFFLIRDRLVHYVADGLQTNDRPKVLIASLRELTTAFGVPKYEADYILAEAEARLGPQEQVDAAFEEILARQRENHHERMAAITALGDPEDDLVRRLSEAEQRRFQQEMTSLVVERHQSQGPERERPAKT